MEDRDNERREPAQTVQSAQSETAVSAETKPEAAPEQNEPETPPAKISGGLRKALIRCGIALAAAVVLLTVTHFSVFEIMKGPKETQSVQSEQTGAFIKRDIYAIVGYSEDEKSGESIVGEYAVVPIDGKFVVVHLPRRYLTDADNVLDETKAYVEGSSTGLDKYFVVDGTAGKLTDAQSKKLSDWFTTNKDWLVQTHVIDSTGDAETYLSDAILEVDRIDGMSQITVIILSCIAGLFLAYIVLELILMACGHYLDDRRKAALVAADETFTGETTEEIVAECAENSLAAEASAQEEPAEAPADPAEDDQSEEK